MRLGELLSLQWQQVRERSVLPGGRRRRRSRGACRSRRRCGPCRRTTSDPAGGTSTPGGVRVRRRDWRRRGSSKTAWRLTCRRAKIAGLALSRSETGSGLAVDGCRGTLGDDSALARAPQHQPDIEVPGRVARGRRGGDARVEQGMGRLPQIAVSRAPNGSRRTRTRKAKAGKP